MAEYKTMRKYKCPYCDYKGTRNDLIDHVNKKHTDMLPEGYTAARAVYDFINGKNYGICMICKDKVYEWNDKINRYYNLCSKPSCREEVRRRAKENHIRVHNCEHLLNDPEQQEKMLAARKISGTYTFSDGGKVQYTGTYEKKCLEFMDKVMEIPSKDIQAPGPILKYEYEGKEHFWITDIYYIPGNLLIEVKDGGSNPNNRSMQSYRDKQVAKETMVTELGIFNYIRLTNNQFDQLLAIFADMKNEALENPNPRATIHINEEVGGIPPHRPPEAYIVPYGMNNVFDGFAYADSEDTDVVIPSKDGFKRMDKKAFEEKYTVGHRLYYKGDDLPEKIKSIREMMTKALASPYVFAEQLLNMDIPVIRYQDILMAESFEYYSRTHEDTIYKLLENGILHQANNIKYGESDEKNTIDTKEFVKICKDITGFYTVTPEDFYMVSQSYTDMEDLLKSGVIDLMNDVYKANSRKRMGA